MANELLTKESANGQIKAYFEGILKLYQSGEQFPVSLDEVWALAYSRKDKAVNALRRGQFFEGTDFQASQNRKVVSINNLQNGVPTDIRLSVKGLEFLIARKNRSVFEVYRNVFQKIATGEVAVIPNTTMTALPSYQIDDPIERAQRWIEEQKQLRLTAKRAEEAEQHVITLTSEVEQRNAVIKEQMPKVEHFDMFMGGFGDNKNVCIRTFCNQARIDGEKRFWDWLFSKKMIYRGKGGTAMPYADYADIFVMEDTINKKTGWSGRQIMVQGTL